jgi:NAD(P)-dependent dehydrogenase (short-subunit alcohol dehydrogenase family)
MYELSNKVVAVTGGNRGIGLAIAHAYGRRGAKVALLARNEVELARAARELQEAAIPALPIRCDVTSETDCRDAVGRVRADLGEVDVLVNNAGVGLLAPVEELTAEVLLEVFAINVLGPLLLTRLVLPSMRARGDGQIVFVSSVVGMRALPGLGGYAATKAGLNAIADSLRAELRTTGVDVITVCPGKTATTIVETARGTGSGRRPFDRFQPTMQPNDVAEAIVRASERRTARITLGLSAHVLELAQRISPKVCDLITNRTMGPKG